jgi:hypothetical protein
MLHREVAARAQNQHAVAIARPAWSRQVSACSVPLSSMALVTNSPSPSVQ